MPMISPNTGNSFVAKSKHSLILTEICTCSSFVLVVFFCKKPSNSRSQKSSRFAAKGDEKD